MLIFHRPLLPVESVQTRTRGGKKRRKKKSKAQVSNCTEAFSKAWVPHISYSKEQIHLHTLELGFGADLNVSNQNQLRTAKPPRKLPL